MAAIVKDGVLTRFPIIVILGATGTGKSKLALQVANKFNGEIISVDAMQVYRGLNIVTNKVTAEEQRVAPHHMIDYLSPGNPTTVVSFRDKAVPIIDSLLERRKLPVLAGGTYYYLESLLWKNLIASGHYSDADEHWWESDAPGGLGDLRYAVSVGRGECEGADGGPATKKARVESAVSVRKMVREVMRGKVKQGEGQDVAESLTSEDKQRLHQLLQDVDPQRASDLHPNNVRKVIRSLQVLDSTGRRHSTLLKEQRAAGGDNLGGPLRYPHSAVLWITCDKEVLNGRLEARVDQMIEQGLIAELEEFHRQFNLCRMAEGDQKPAYTLGIFQTIGFKEFHDYLMLSPEEKLGEEAQTLLKRGVEQMKVATKQYARRQERWIKQRFLGRRALGQMPPVYTLNGTEVAQWDSAVRDKANSIVQALIEGAPCPVAAEKPGLVGDSEDRTKLVRCEDCARYFVGRDQLNLHLTSKKHLKTLERIEREKIQQSPAFQKWTESNRSKNRKAKVREKLESLVAVLDQVAAQKRLNTTVTELENK